jgi:hypothetical protein
MVTALLLILLSLGSFQAADRPADARTIERVKRAVVRDIDPALPPLRLEAWLADLAGPNVETKWEVNDCGEQTGNPELDRGRDFPMCVEAHLSLAQKRDLYLSLVVGTFTKGLTPGPPRFSYGCLTERGVPVKWLKTLHEAPGVLRPPR